MSDRAFIVKIDLPDDIPADIAAQDIEDAVNDLFEVKSVAPWQEHNSALTAAQDLLGKPSTKG